MMKTKARPLRRQIRSAKLTSFVRWIVSSFYLLAMVGSLLSRTDGYQPWLALEVAAFTVSYGILMLLLWPHEQVAQLPGRM